MFVLWIQDLLFVAITTRIIHHVINAKLIQEAENAAFKIHLTQDVTHAKLILAVKHVVNLIHSIHPVIIV